MEDSDVLVLSSRSTLPDPSIVGAEVLYLDLRLSLPTTKPVRINWAFAGLRETIPLDEEEENAVRYHWEHTIDSHGGDEPPDKGTMVKGKGESIEVESGVGRDPETGKMGPYEEVWKCVQLVNKYSLGVLLTCSFFRRLIKVRIHPFRHAIRVSHVESRPRPIHQIHDSSWPACDGPLANSF